MTQNRILQPKYSTLFYNSQLKGGRGGGGEGVGVNMNLSEIFRKFKVGLKVDPRILILKQHQIFKISYSINFTNPLGKTIYFRMDPKITKEFSKQLRT